MSDQYNTLVHMLAVLLSETHILSKEGNYARNRLLHILNIKHHTPLQLKQEAIESYLLEQFVDAHDLINNDLLMEAKSIFTRLEGGDRLIAYTAGGVSWESAFQEKPTRYEMPDRDALTYLVLIKRVVPADVDLPFHSKSIPVRELVINPEFGK